MRRLATLLLFGLCADAAQIPPKFRYLVKASSKPPPAKPALPLPQIPPKFRHLATTSSKPPPAEPALPLPQVQQPPEILPVRVLPPKNPMGKLLRQLLAPVRPVQAAKASRQEALSCCDFKNRDPACVGELFPADPSTHSSKDPIAERNAGQGLSVIKVHRDAYMHTNPHKYGPGLTSYKFSRFDKAFKRIYVVAGVPIMTSDLTWLAARVAVTRFASYRMGVPVNEPPVTMMNHELQNWRKNFNTDEGIFMAGAQPVCNDDFGTNLKPLAKRLESGISVRAICTIIETLIKGTGVVVMALGPKGTPCTAESQPRASSYVTVFGFGINANSYLQNTSELLEKCHYWTPPADLWQQLHFFANDPGAERVAENGDCATVRDSMILTKADVRSTCTRPNLDMASSISLVQFTGGYEIACGFALDFTGFAPSRETTVQASRMWLAQAAYPHGPGPSFATANVTEQVGQQVEKVADKVGNYGPQFAHVLPV